MATPYLYHADETSFTYNGYGTLTDTIECLVTESRNGLFELNMTYPVDGKLFKEIKEDRLLKCDAAVDLPQQRFRIVTISKPINGVIAIYAQHVSYQAAYMQLRPNIKIENVLAQQALERWKASLIGTPNPFTVYSDLTGTNSTTWTIDKAENARMALGGMDGSILDVWGGEYKFDNYNVRLLTSRGEDRGLIIKYGKNLTDLTQEESIESTYTGVYPFAKYTKQLDSGSSEERILTLPSPYYIETENARSFAHSRILHLDLSNEEWGKDTEGNPLEPTTDKLRQKAEAYIKANGLGVPKISLKVSFIDLSKTLEYQDIKNIVQARLCDTVTVEFEKLGVSAKAKIVKTVWDVKRERYDSLEIGEARANLATSFKELEDSFKEGLEQKPGKSDLQQAISNATDQITGAIGGNVVIRPKENPEEILIMDTDNIKTARNVWRWNAGGLGYSSNGYNGPYETAITADGSIVATFITAGILSANLIKTGALEGKSCNINLETGVFQIGDRDEDGNFVPVFEYYNAAGKTKGVRAFGELQVYEESGISTIWYEGGGFNIYFKDQNGKYVLCGGLAGYYDNNTKKSEGLHLFSTEDKKLFLDNLVKSASGNYTKAAVVLDHCETNYKGQKQKYPGTYINGNINLCDFATGAQINFYNGEYFKDSGYIEENSPDMNLRFEKNDAGSYTPILKTALFRIEGGFAATEGKARLVKTKSYGERCLNAYETADCYFGDIGEAKTDQDGVCVITLDPVFLETINTKEAYHIFIQENGPGKLYIDKREQHQFVVKGTPELAFSYEIKAKQKGYETTRLQEVK